MNERNSTNKEEMSHGTKYGISDLHLLSSIMCPIKCAATNSFESNYAPDLSTYFLCLPGDIETFSPKIYYWSCQSEKKSSSHFRQAGRRPSAEN